MSIKNIVGIKTHLGLGIFYGVLAGMIQGLIEAFALSISYNGYILVPQDIFKFHLFVVVRKILHFNTGESITFILDRYIGPDFIDKIPFIFNLVAAYAIVGLLGGICLGIFLWVAFRFVKKSPDSGRLSIFYLVLIASFSVIFNLIIWINGKDIVKGFAGVLISLILIAAAFLFNLVIYRFLAVKGSSGEDKSISPEVFRVRSKSAILAVVLIACMGLVLNKWILKDRGASEILAAQMNHAADNVLTEPHDKNVNIILISIDSLRSDHLGSYGYSRKTSPNIDRLAGEGVLFSKAFSTTCWTLPSHISMLTSMYSEAHGVITEYDHLDENRITLAEVLKERDYSTAAFVSGPYVHSRYGYNQGFDLYDDSIIDDSAEAGKDLVQEITTPQLNQSIQSWLTKNHQKKFFLFLHYFDVHFDYIPPSPYDTMFDPDYKGTIDARNFYHNPRINQDMSPRDLEHVIALYDGEIAFTDKYIGDLIATLKKLGIYDNTLIILTSDHGQEFFEHGFKGHRRTLYDEVLHVPLIFKFPSSWKAGAKSNEVVSIVDIMPTVLDYAGIKPNEEMQGRSLLSLLNGDKKSNDLLIYARHEYKLFAVRSAGSKLIHSGGLAKKEFYDLVNDPREKINLFDEAMSSKIPAERKKSLEAEASEGLVSFVNWQNAQRHFHNVLPKAGAKDEIKLSDSAKEQLKALGYLQ